jgi:hypothetical protein
MSKRTKKEGLDYLNTLETGRLELEALLKLTAIHFNTEKASADPNNKAIGAATADAVFQLACIKAHTLLFDRDSNVASVKNLFDKNFPQSGTDNLRKLASDVILLTEDPLKKGSYIATVLSPDQINSDPSLRDINRKRGQTMEARVREVRIRFDELYLSRQREQLSLLRNSWLAHSSLDAGDIKFAHQFSLETFRFIERCALMLRESIEAHTPAKFESVSRETWHKINNLPKSNRSNPSGERSK